MVGEQIVNDSDSMAEILGRAFGPPGGLTPAAAEVILRARLTEADVRRVDELLEQKRERGLKADEEAVLRDYLRADSLLTVLKSKARRSLGDRAAE